MKKLVAKRQTKNKPTHPFALWFLFLSFSPLLPQHNKRNKTAFTKKSWLHATFSGNKKVPTLVPGCSHLLKKISRKQATIKLFPTKRASPLISRGYLRVMMSGETGAIKNLKSKLCCHEANKQVPQRAHSEKETFGWQLATNKKIAVRNKSCHLLGNRCTDTTKRKTDGKRACFKDASFSIHFPQASANTNGQDKAMVELRWLSCQRNSRLLWCQTFYWGVDLLTQKLKRKPTVSVLDSPFPESFVKRWPIFGELQQVFGSHKLLFSLETLWGWGESCNCKRVLVHLSAHQAGTEIAGQRHKFAQK